MVNKIGYNQHPDKTEFSELYKTHTQRECFDNKLSVEDCAKVENLQIIPWEDNLKKRIFKGRMIDD
jgi:hypothetical protein